MQCESPAFSFSLHNLLFRSHSPRLSCLPLPWLTTLSSFNIRMETLSDKRGGIQITFQYVCITNQPIDSNYTHEALIVKLIMSGLQHPCSSVTFTQGNAISLLFVCPDAFWDWASPSSCTVCRGANM